MRQVLGEVLQSIVEETGASYGALLRLDRMSRTFVIEVATDERPPAWPEPLAMDELPSIARHSMHALQRAGALCGLVVLGYDAEPAAAPDSAAMGPLMRCAALTLELGRKQEAVAESTTALARDIHDTLAQTLALIVMQLADAQDKLGPAWALAREPLETARQLAVHSLAEARLSVSVLRPPRAAPGGLCGVVQEMAALVRRYYRGHLDVRVTGAPHDVEAAVEAELAGIVREALTNAATHAQAGRIEVAVEFPDERGVTILVEDDGQGFDPDRPRDERYGLVGMRERAARIGAALTVITEPGAGTQVIAVWP